MGAVVVGLAVEAGGGREVTRLPGKEDALGVDEPPVGHLERHSRAQELGAQDRQVEAGDVVPGQIAALE